MMSIRSRGLVTGALAIVLGVPAMGQDLEQKLAAAKQSAARNQQALRGYTWIEKTELRLKGEVKNTKISQCQYGPDGKVQKTEMTQPSSPPAAAPAQKRRGGGLKAKVIEKKTGEMKEEMESAVALVHQYVPPSPDKIQTVMAAGTAATVPAEDGLATLQFRGYAKPGDMLALTFDQAVKSLRKITVNTWLDEPAKAVTLQVTMQSLPDGTDYASAVTLSIPSNKIEVRVTNSNYQKIMP